MNGKDYECSMGTNGAKDNKSEGDGTTPVGTFQLRKVYYRADEIQKPSTKLPVEALDQDDVWCDDMSHETYNTHVKMPHPGSFENLWRGDDLYDMIVLICYNDDPIIPGKGSAIFIHIAREDYSSTAGCIALSMPYLLEILRFCDSDTQISIIK